MTASWLNDTLSHTLLDLAGWAAQDGQDALAATLREYAADVATMPWQELTPLAIALKTELNRPVEAFAFHAAAARQAPGGAIREENYLAAVEICRRLTSAADQKTKARLMASGFDRALVELLAIPMAAGLSVGQRFSILLTLSKFAHQSQHRSARHVGIAVLPHFLDLCEAIAPDDALMFYTALLPIVWGHVGTLHEMVDVDPLVDGLLRNIRRHVVPVIGERRSSTGHAVAYFTVFNTTTSGIGCATHTLAAAHAAHPGTDPVFLYIFGGENAESIAYHRDTGVPLRFVKTHGDLVTTLTALWQQLDDDGIEVLIADNIFGITVATLAARAAPIQLMIEATHIYGNHPGVDWWFLGAEDFRVELGLPAVPSSLLPGFRGPHSVATSDPAGATRIRAELPPDAIVVGSICRLTKVQPRFLAVLGRLLAEEPSVHFLVCGSGDASLIQDWIAREELGTRVTLVNEHVSVPSYGLAMDIFAETWPFIGGATATELMSFGRPVVSMYSAHFATCLANMRDAELVASDEDQYLALLRRLIADPGWCAERVVATQEISNLRSDPGPTVDEIQRVIKLLRCRTP